MLRDQPYLPLYVQDFLTDEKLMECSAAATGIYIRIICILHKQKEYGCFLLKQKYKQSDKQALNFASQLAKFLPYDKEEIYYGLNELIEEGVLFIEEDRLCQKRMIRDNEISIKRAEAGSKGGKKTQFAKAKTQAKGKAKHQANTENEYETIYSNHTKNRTTEVKVREFYDLELSKNPDKDYERFIKCLFGDNSTGEPLRNLLRLQKQVTYTKFKKVKEYRRKYNVIISEYLEKMNNWKKLNKNNTDLQLTLLDWIRRDNEKQ